MSDSLPDSSFFAGLALGIASQEWSLLGLGSDPSVAPTDNLEVTTDRITALMLIRVVGWIQPRGTFTDLSTVTICRQVLVDNESWPQQISEDVLDQLKKYVKVILSRYQKVPYHNMEHCYHVTISVNKLMDMILQLVPGADRAPTFGFRDDPLMHFALLFSALIHDVEHHGISNRQLANEDDLLAIQYNDTSISEHRSLYIAFSELLKPEYQLMRKALFPEVDDYRRFRSAVINVVLTTDIASPERSQISKSKWKEAFGDPYETVERKVLHAMERRATSKAGSSKKTHQKRANRRMSSQSFMSELSLNAPGDLDESGLKDDSSASETPDSSEVEDNDQAEDDASQSSFTIPLNDEGELPLNDSAGSLNAVPDQSGPVFRPPKSTSNDSGSRSNLSGTALKFHRRLSSIGSGNARASSKRYRGTRLGLLRTVDLSGETIQTFNLNSPRLSATGATTGSSSVSFKLFPPEEVDELKETVVMETIIKAADVGHNLQGWEQMTLYSNRLFLELRSAYVQGRAEDPQNGWFSNQIGFLDAYLLPLARRLDDTGVFGDIQGARFAEIVEENKDRWMREGMSITAQVIREGDIMFPSGDTTDEDA